MTRTFSVEDLYEVAGAVAEAWRGGLNRDWDARAGTLEWSCRQTADHAVDTLVAPAFFLASRKTDAYPDGGWSPGVEAAPEAFVDGVEMGARILGAVVSAAPPDARAIIFRRPVTVSPPADFAPRGALELVLHAHDVCSGLGVEFEPPRPACEKLRQHVQSWPFWKPDFWPPLTMTGDPWHDLLRSTHRVDDA